MRYGSPLSISGSYEHLQATVEKGQVAFATIANFADFAKLEVWKTSIPHIYMQPPHPPVFFPSTRMLKPDRRTIAVRGKPLWAGGAGAVLPHSQFTNFAKSANRERSGSRTCWGAMHWFEFLVLPTRLYSDSNRHGALWEQFVCPGLVDFGTQGVLTEFAKSASQSRPGNREILICTS